MAAPDKTPRLARCFPQASRLASRRAGCILFHCPQWGSELLHTQHRPRQPQPQPEGRSSAQAEAQCDSRRYDTIDDTRWLISSTGLAAGTEQRAGQHAARPPGPSRHSAACSSLEYIATVRAGPCPPRSCCLLASRLPPGLPLPESDPRVLPHEDSFLH